MGSHVEQELALLAVDLVDFLGLGGDGELVGDVLNDDDLVVALLAAAVLVPPLPLALLHQLQLHREVGALLASHPQVHCLVALHILKTHRVVVVRYGLVGLVDQPRVLPKALHDHSA